jgi:excisionase family DNA binding protein
MSINDPLQLLTTAEVAALFRRSRGWVKAKRDAGDLPYLRDGRDIRFRRADVERFQKTLEQPETRVRLAAVVPIGRAA